MVHGITPVLANMATGGTAVLLLPYSETRRNATFLGLSSVISEISFDGRAYGGGAPVPNLRKAVFTGLAARGPFYGITGGGTGAVLVFEGSGNADFDQAGAATGLAIETIDFFLSGAMTTGTLKAATMLGLAGTIVDVRARELTAPVGAATIVDVNKNGTTLFTTQANRPTVADGANVSSTTLPDVTAVAAGDYISIDIDQIGSGTAGSNLLVSVTIARALV